MSFDSQRIRKYSICSYWGRLPCRTLHRFAFSQCHSNMSCKKEMANEITASVQQHRINVTIPLSRRCRHRNNHNCCLGQNLLQLLIVLHLIQIISEFLHRMQVFHFANNQWIQFGKTLLELVLGKFVNDSCTIGIETKISLSNELDIRKFRIVLHISLSMSAAMLFASTMSWYSGSDSTLPIISFDFLGHAMYSSIFRKTVLSSSESCSLHTSRIDDTC